MSAVVAAMHRNVADLAALRRNNLRPLDWPRGTVVRATVDGWVPAGTEGAVAERWIHSERNMSNCTPPGRIRVRWDDDTMSSEYPDALERVPDDD